ncbi:helix-turn-helix transcriptional regulator [Qingshengfaniella alkalisoli]|uniref:YafY family transcriptional regulator n=1 Tax=Qingshengfaniella alkalisoli TaxID=2599296 RepID=A0A5B8ISE3_9RHOB|nr:YafY family protein [Qingshengfaniella alkalisoli]QDY68343.1 YafY family transcriptional regulator [Qingshengfaniella alkalisoli]
MARSDRLFRLLHLIRSTPQPVTAARLSEEMGVSERTIYRDIDTLRAGGALIDGEAGYGFTLTEDPALPPQSFSRLEIEALVQGLAEVQQRGDPALVAAAADALKKITGTLPERQQREAIHAVTMVHRWDKQAPPPDGIEILRAACWDEMAVDLQYKDREDNVTKRRIWPLSIVFLDTTQGVLAWCCLRQDFRQFILPRIVSISRTGESFRPRRVPLLRDYVERLREPINRFGPECPLRSGHDAEAGDPAARRPS